jgi:hypothetical protein
MSSSSENGNRQTTYACGTEDIREANPPTDIGFRLASLSVVNNSPLIYIFVHPSLQLYEQNQYPYIP